MRRAFITGISGQDGSYLAEFLLAQGYEVHGLIRDATLALPALLKHLANDPVIANRQLQFHHGEIENPESLRRAINTSAPDEIYHLAGLTHVGASFEKIETTYEIVALGTLRILEIVRQLPKPAKFFFASSSEIFGRPDLAPQDELTPFRPVTPYGVAKTFATQMVSIYRQTFGMFACNGILFNHESPRRGENFVTQKICRAAAEIKKGRQQELWLGNLDGKRDWGDARDYVRGMWLALQHSTPEDFVFATGKLHSVKDVLEIAFAMVHLDWRNYLRQDPKLLRPHEPTKLIGNAAKAEKLLGWKTANSFEKLIAEMTLNFCDQTASTH